MREVRKWTFHVPDAGLSIRLETVANDDDFKKLRKQMNRELADVMRDTAQRVVVPQVNSRARFVHTVTGQGVVAKRGGRKGVYITTLAGTKGQGNRKKARIAGYLEFGGIVRKPIGPMQASSGATSLRTIDLGEGEGKLTGDNGERATQQSFRERKRRRSRTNAHHAGAVSTPYGPRFIVTKPRKFAGKHLIRAAIKGAVPAYTDALTGRVLKLVQDEGFDIQK